MLFELPPTTDIGTKSVTPAPVTPWVRPFTPRGWLASFDVHCSAKPGFARAAAEILSSVRIQLVRWASASAVSHCEPPPRPGCASATPTTAAKVDISTRRRLARITAPCSLPTEVGSHTYGRLPPEAGSHTYGRLPPEGGSHTLGSNS